MMSKLGNQIPISLPGCQIRAKNLNGNLFDRDFTLWSVLCPMYSNSELSKSKLISKDEDFSDSRVFIKWTVLSNIIEQLDDIAQSRDITITIVFVFADRGVLIDGNDFNETQIVNQFKRYSNLINSLSRGLKNTVLMVTSDSLLGIKTPIFLKVSRSIKKFESVIDFITLIEKSLKIISQIDEHIGISRKSKRSVTRLLKSMDEKTAFWLLIGSLSFMSKLAKLIDNGIFLSLERFDPLHGIIDLIPDFKSIPTIRVTC